MALGALRVVDTRARFDFGLGVLARMILSRLRARSGSETDGEDYRQSGDWWLLKVSQTPASYLMSEVPKRVASTR